MGDHDFPVAWHTAVPCCIHQGEAVWPWAPSRKMRIDVKPQRALGEKSQGKALATQYNLLGFSSKH